MMMTTIRNRIYNLNKHLKIFPDTITQGWKTRVEEPLKIPFWFQNQRSGSIIFAKEHIISTTAWGEGGGLGFVSLAKKNIYIY